MSHIKNLKKLLGAGPLLLFSGAAIEGVTLCAQRWISFSIQLPFASRIILTIVLIGFFLTGMAWFNFSLNLIKVNFLGGKRELVIHGPFTYVRHPLYSIMIFTLPPLMIIWLEDLLFVIPWIIILIAAHFLVGFEERELKRQFGKAYERYQKYVPALLPYKGPNGKRHHTEIMKGSRISSDFI